MLVQHSLIDAVREACHADARLDAALMYGSFASGDADAHSDIEFWLFFAPRKLAGVDRRAWCAQVAPVTHLVRNEFGTDVAFFPGLIRGEFHFATTDDIPTVRTWPARGAPVDRMVVLDRGGRLRPALESLPYRPPVPDGGDGTEALCGRFANWLVLAHHVAARGEFLRAWDALGHAHRHLLWMARRAEDSTAHWLTPSRAAEAELPSQAVAKLSRATAAGQPDDIRDALRAAWEFGRECWGRLAQRYGRPLPLELFADIERALG
jgi:lincosamide nucleotidyltransferase